MDKKSDKNITKKFRTNRPAKNRTKIWMTVSDRKTDKKILHKSEFSSNFCCPPFLPEILSEVLSYFLSAFRPICWSIFLSEFNIVSGGGGEDFGNRRNKGLL